MTSKRYMGVDSGSWTTKAVVISAITIFVSDFFLTKLIIYF